MLLVGLGTLVQIRDVPDEMHRTLKSRAAAAGVSLSEYLRTVLERTLAAHPRRTRRADRGARGDQARTAQRERGPLAARRRRVTVLDTSAAVDFLLGSGIAPQSSS